MKIINDEILVDCLKFLQNNGGKVSRYSFDKYITKNFKINEGFNLIPKQLIKDDLVEIIKESDLTIVSISEKGIIKIRDN
jgi:hypothetical protein